MNIDGGVTGSASVTSSLADGIQGSAPDILIIGIPISFQRFAGTSQALVDAYVREVRTETGERLLPQGRTIIRPHTRPNSGVQEAHSGPILFDAAQQADATVYDFSVALKRNAGSVKELDERALDVDLVLIFTSLQRITMVCSVKPRLGSGELIVEKAERKEPPRPVLRNLTVLALIAGLISAWNWWLNAGVHGSGDYFNSTTVAFVMGTIMTFIGLSFATIMDWLKSLRALKDVIRFPELHVSPASTWLLSLRYTGVCLASILAASLTLIWVWWSIPLPTDKRVGVIHDVLQKSEVTAPRIYHRQANAKRFTHLCKDDAALPVLGFVTPSWFGSVIAPEEFEVSFPGFLGAKVIGRGTEATEIVRSRGAELLDLKFDEPARAALRREMCGDPSDTPVAVERRDNKIVLSSHAHATRASLQAKLTSYREDNLKDREASALWQGRKNHVNTLSGQLIDSLRASKQRVSREDTLAILATLLTEARQQGTDNLDLKRTIERVILARAMLVTFATSGSDHFEDSHAATIIDAVAERLKRIEVGASNFRIARSLWELLLTFEQRFPDAAGDRVHDAILSTGRRGLLREGTEPLWMYVRSVSVVYTPATPEQLGPSSRIAFFTSPTTVRILKKKAETAELTSALVWVRSNEPLADADWSQVNKALGELWAISYAGAG